MPSRIGSHEISIVMPMAPAVVNSTAMADQVYAASTPIETSVSIVVAPCLAFAHAARWNGAPPHSTTIEASRNAIHCHQSNCSAGIIDISSTGTVSTALIRHRRPSSSGSSSTSSSGIATPYPVASTTATRSSTLTSPVRSTCAVSVA